MSEYRLFLFNISELMDMLALTLSLSLSLSLSHTHTHAHTHTHTDGCASCTRSPAAVAVLFSKLFFSALSKPPFTD